jgi:hypothetical protein
MQPNLVPPITTIALAIDYRSRLQAIEPDVRYLMSLYLHISSRPRVEVVVVLIFFIFTLPSLLMSLLKQLRKVSRA